MSNDDDSAEKSHDPTPEKLRKAREEGQIPKSTDLTTAGVYFGFLLLALSAGGASLIALGEGLTSLLSAGPTLAGTLFEGSGQPMVRSILMRAMVPLAPWFIVPAVVAVLLLLAQQAIAITPKNVQPKMSRISILSNAKNKFGRTGLFEFAKSTTKLVIYGTIMGVFLVRNTEDLLLASSMSSGQVVAKMAILARELLIYVVLVAATIGLVDLFWQRAEHMRKNRMSRKELMDEVKNSEGDPELKQKRRQKGQEIALNSMLAEVPKADVVIVNPTHYAVALTWDRGSGRAPTCVAKGVDEIAAKIRAIAAENAIPVHSDPPTARALHAGLDIGDEISPEHFVAVAAAIRFADEMREKARKW